MGDLSAHVLAGASLDRLDPSNRLLAAYLHTLPEVRDLFPHPLADMPALARRQRAQADRAALAEALASFQQHLGAAPAAVQQARLLADPATPVVTVGQQPGLLTGPLYTVYKAATALALAQRLRDEIGRPVVTAFWVATDDDDRAEADHCSLWDQQYNLHTIRYPEGAGRPGQLIGDLPVAEYGDEIIAQVAPLLAGQPHTNVVLDLLRDALGKSADLGEWCCRLLAALFSAQGLVICDPRQPAIRRLGAEVMAREIIAPLRTTELVNRQARTIQQRGYHPALIKPAETSNFFLYDGNRRRVTYQHGRYFAGGREYPVEELLALLEETPECLLPNAVLRPVVQEYLFGSTAFVAGPNELCYWAELRPVFDALDVEMPVVVPRAGATLVPPFVSRRLADWEVAPLDLLLHFDQTRLGLLERRQPAAISQAFATSHALLDLLVSELTSAVEPLDATLAQSALGAHQRMCNEVERLERKTLKAVERQSSDLAGKLALTREILCPGRGLQERTLNVCSLLARIGLDGIASLPQLFDRQEGCHVVVEI